MLIRAPDLRRPGVDRRATWLELFFDLAFAAAIADAGTALSGDYNLAGLVRFALLFVMIWWAWVGHTFFSTWFDNDDLVQRLLTLAQVFFVAVMSVNTRTDMASREAAGFAAAYAGIRILLAVQYSRVVSVAETRPFVKRQLIGIATGALIWLTAALVPYPARALTMIVALSIDLLTPLLARRAAGVIPADPAHLPERFGLFTLILIGESVVAITAGMRHQEHWTPAAAGSAVLGMLLAFALWWIYFDLLGGASPKPAPTHSHGRRLTIWTAAHFPLTFGIAVAAVGIEHTIRLDGLTPLGGAAWLLAGGVGIVVLALGTLGISAPERLGAPGRLVARHLAVALVLVAVAVGGTGVAPVWLLASIVALLGVLITAGHRAATAAQSPP